MSEQNTTEFQNMPTESEVDYDKLNSETFTAEQSGTSAANPAVSLNQSPEDSF